MAEVSTQVVDQPTQTFSAQYIQNMSIVDQYKSVLSQIRLQRIGLVAQIKQMISDLSNMNSAHQNMIDQFTVKAVQMYPQYAGQDLKPIIASLSQDNPLVQMWMNYSQSVNDVRSAIQSRAMQLSDLATGEQSLEDQEAKTLASYADFASQAGTTVPSVADIQSSLATVDAIPVADEQFSISTLPAIEDLSPEAAAAVTLQVAQNSDPSTPVDLTVAVQSAVAQPVQPSLMTAISNLHPVIKYGGAALILMALFK